MPCRLVRREGAVQLVEVDRPPRLIEVVWEHPDDPPDPDPKLEPAHKTIMVTILIMAATNSWGTVVAPARIAAADDPAVAVDLSNPFPDPVPRTAKKRKRQLHPHHRLLHHPDPAPKCSSSLTTVSKK
jgi:hypothetical protein